MIVKEHKKQALGQDDWMDPLYLDELLTDEQVLDLQVIINNIPADGKAKQRVMKNLDIIYGNEK